jgi:hypothetical protein
MPEQGTRGLSRACRRLGSVLRSVRLRLLDRAGPTFRSFKTRQLRWTDRESVGRGMIYRGAWVWYWEVQMHHSARPSWEVIKRWPGRPDA